MKRRPQAKWIADDIMLLDVVRLSEGGTRWVLLSELVESLDLPRKVVLAKARKLILRGKLQGCFCGCSGGFYIPGGRWGS